MILGLLMVGLIVASIWSTDTGISVKIGSTIGIIMFLIYV